MICVIAQGLFQYKYSAADQVMPFLQEQTPCSSDAAEFLNMILGLFMKWQIALNNKFFSALFSEDGGKKTTQPQLLCLQARGIVIIRYLGLFTIVFVFLQIN